MPWRRPASLRQQPPTVAADVPEEPETGVALAPLLAILYPDAEDLGEVIRKATEILGTSRVASLSDVRRVILGMERQLFPTPVTIQFRPSDLLMVQTEGFRLYLDAADPAVSVGLGAGTPYEPHVTAIVRRLCRPGMRVCDIGANIGYFSVLLGGLVGEGGRVMAFEPSSENVRLILASLALNELTNVDVVPLGLDDRGGVATFVAAYGSNGGFMGDGVKVSGGKVIPTTTLDTYLGDERVDLIKIDVEGAEARVMAGGAQTVARHRPIVISELSFDMMTRVSHAEPAEYLARFEDLGYRCFIIDRATPGELVAFENAGQLLATFDDRYQIEDVLLVPEGVDLSSPGAGSQLD